MNEISLIIVHLHDV